MTLTELKYVVALAHERHFGRAAQKCFVTQPTLSLALAKLEDELGVKLFERNKNEVLVTARGQAIVEQARRVLDEAGKIQHIARGGKDQLAGALRLGVIPTIGPYLLPELVPILRKRAPSMPLMIEENLTGNLAPMLREGERGVRGAVQRRRPRRPQVAIAPRGEARGPRRREPARPQQRALLPRPGARGVPGPIEHRAPRGPRRQLARDHPQHGRLGPGRERASVERARAALHDEAGAQRAVHEPRAVTQGGARVARDLRSAARRGHARRGDPGDEGAVAADGQAGVAGKPAPVV